MSTTVLCYGVITALEGPPINEERREQLNDKYDKDGFQINYEGTLVYVDLNAAKSYNERENLHKVLLFGAGGRHMETYSTLCRILAQENIKAELFAGRWFSCVWHNGSDSPLNEMTLEQFRDPDFGA